MILPFWQHRGEPAGQQARLDRNPNAAVSGLGLGPDHGSCNVIGVTSAESYLLAPHIYGDVVLQTIFGRPLGDPVQVYSRSRRTISWPWLDIDADIPQPLHLLQKSSVNDPERVELEALNYGYGSASDLLDRAREQFHSR